MASRATESFEKADLYSTAWLLKSAFIFSVIVRFLLRVAEKEAVCTAVVKRYKAKFKGRSLAFVNDLLFNTLTLFPVGAKSWQWHLWNWDQHLHGYGCLGILLSLMWPSLFHGTPGEEGRRGNLKAFFIQAFILSFCHFLLSRFLNCKNVCATFQLCYTHLLNQKSYLHNLIVSVSA